MLYYIYFALIFSSIFQDFFLVNYIGEFGRSITAIVVIPIFIIYSVVLRKKIYINKYIKMLVGLAIYLLFINILALFKYLVIDVGSINLLDENVVIQTVKGYIYFLNIVIFMLLLYNLQKNLTEEQVFKPFVFTFLFLFLILIIELRSIPDALPLLHNNFPYYRVRLTTMESSSTSSIIVIFFAATYYYYKNIKNNKMMSISSFIIFCIFVVNSSSKGFVLNILITLFIMIFIDGNLKKKIISILVLGITIYIGIPFIKENMMNDLQYYTSIVTRGYTVAIGILFILVKPLGVGNALYLVEYPKLLDKYIHIFNNINFKFNLSEIYTFINASSSKNIAAKSGFIQYGLYWGLVGSVVMLIFIIKVYKSLFKYKNHKFSIIKFAYVNTILLIITVIGFDIKYEIWILFSLVIYLSESNINSNEKLIN